MIPKRTSGRRNELRSLPFFDDLSEVRCQSAIVASKHLIEGPLGPGLGLAGRLFALGGFALVLLYLDLKIGHHGSTPRNKRTTFDSSSACAEMMAALRKFHSRFSVAPISGAEVKTLTYLQVLYKWVFYKFGSSIRHQGCSTRRPCLRKAK